MVKPPAALLIPILLLIATCDRPPAHYVFLVDLPMMDRCFFLMRERPDDCFFPPCMYADGSLELKKSDTGASLLSARNGGGAWPDGAIRSEDPRFRRSRARPATPVAHALPEVLSALELPPRPMAQTCLAVRVDQELRFGDMMEFLRELHELGPRHVALWAEAADDPIRLVRVSLNGASREQLYAQLRKYAASNGLEFLHPDIPEFGVFALSGRGLHIEGSHPGNGQLQLSSMAPPPDPDRAFDVMLKLGVARDGAEPTEERMDAFLRAFIAAVSELDGVSVELEKRKSRSCGDYLTCEREPPSP